MSGDTMAVLALFVSILSLLVSLLALSRDRHSVRVRTGIYEQPRGQWSLAITVMNQGKRPISMAFITVRQPGEAGRSAPFGQNGHVRIDVGEAATANLEPGNFLHSWSNIEELRSLEVDLEDVLGKKYRAKI